MISMLAFLNKLFSTKKLNAAEAWKASGKEVGNAYWIYAAPVHLVLQRDSFSLAAPAPLALEKDEIEALTATLNAHFSADGMQFFWYENTWFLRLNQNPHIETSYPELVMNKDISAFTPKGVGAMAWAAFMNEVQMLLFEHPVNQARESNQLLVMNSLWCYGGGILEKNSKPHAN